ncbi:MAG: hypothetical protein HYZ92_07020 [Candidatus Omnitrophica bacterium]|nr:hypothetical protein [Candidatus Omnitrophota bacterium]
MTAVTLGSGSNSRAWRSVLCVGLVLIQILIGCAQRGETQPTDGSQTGKESMTPDSSHHLRPAPVTGVGPWVSYNDPHVPLPFTFEYPNNWLVGAEQGREQPYWQIVILGPRNATSQVSAGMTIRRLPTKAGGGLYENLDSLAAARRRQYEANTTFSLIQEGAVSIQAIQARQVEFSVFVPLPEGRAKPTQLRHRLVQFALDDHLYELLYMADAADFKTYEPVFDRLLASLRVTSRP